MQQARGRRRQAAGRSEEEVRVRKDLEKMLGVREEAAVHRT
jgi:hypothetical protein